MELNSFCSMYVGALTGIAGLLAIFLFLWLFTALIVIAEYQRHDSIR